MKRIMVSECGGALTRNFVMSIRASKEKYHIVGVSSHPYEIMLSNADENYLVPSSSEPTFISVLNALIKKTRVQFLHSQHDKVIAVLSRHEKEIGCPMFLPDQQAVVDCVDKYKSYLKWKAAGLPVPETMEISAPKDLKEAFHRFGKTIWLRAKEGGAGYGALPADDYDFAKHWITRFDGWGKFTAARMLSPDSTTWTSIWKDGELVVAQGRKRLYWLFGSRSLSGVTGITGTGMTIRDPAVDALAQKAIHAVSKHPHGIFSVDITYGLDGTLYLTEINIGRFFTTVHFFTEAGLNLPEIFLKLAFGEKLPKLSRRINPLPPGLLWVRGMDTEPVLTTVKAIEKEKRKLAQLKL